MLEIFKDKNNVIGMVIILIIFTILVWTFTILYNGNQIEEMNYERYVITETLLDKEFVVDGTVETADETIYTVAASDSITLKNILVKELAEISVGDELISYVESTIDYASTNVENNLSEENGYITNITNDKITSNINTNVVFSLNEGESLSGNGCIYYNFNETDVFLNSSDLELNDNIYSFKTNIIKDITVEDSSLELSVLPGYSCNDYEITDGVITKYSSEVNPVFIKNGSATSLTKEYDILIPELDGYIYDRSLIEVSVGDLINKGDILYSNSYSKLITEEKAMMSKVNGVITSIENTDDEVVIKIFNSNQNYFVFNIEEDYEKYVSLSDDLNIKIGDNILETQASEIIIYSDEMLGKVYNDIFTHFEVGETGRVNLEASNEFIILIPLDYIEAGTVKRCNGEQIEKIEVEYVDYNAKYVRILSGLNKTDIIESYLIEE